jgi:hypothetical protein
VTRNLDDLYLSWLYKQVDARSVKERNPSRTHWKLLKQLYSIEFVWFISNDDNRAEDGRALRYEWDDEHRIRVNHDWLLRGCSFLEMLIALTRRLAFEADGQVDVWFWHLLDNINLAQLNDEMYWTEKEVNEAVDRVIWRTYDRNGRGGLFPLKNTRRDQRKIEIWYQLNEYLLTT